MSARPRRLPALVALVGMLGTLPVSAAPPVPVRTIAVRWSGQIPLVSFTARHFVTPEVVRKLKSGLPQTLVTRVYAYAERGNKLLAVSARSCRVVFDLWAEVYSVQEQDDLRDRSHTERTLDGAVRTCLGTHDLAVGDGTDTRRGERIYFVVLIELNPLSPDTVQRIRRWLSRSGGQPLEGDAFFGSFVSIFVSRRMGSAERSLSFRSPSINVP